MRDRRSDCSCSILELVIGFLGRQEDPPQRHLARDRSCSECVLNVFYRLRIHLFLTIFLYHRVVLAVLIYGGACHSTQPAIVIYVRSLKQVFDLQSEVRLYE